MKKIIIPISIVLLAICAILIIKHYYVNQIYIKEGRTIGTFGSKINGKDIEWKIDSTTINNLKEWHPNLKPIDFSFLFKIANEVKFKLVKDTNTWYLDGIELKEIATKSNKWIIVFNYSKFNLQLGTSHPDFLQIPMTIEGNLYKSEIFNNN
jgi:hypothetical protein